MSLSRRLNPLVLRQLQQSPPDVIVLDAETWALAGPGEPIREWIATHYHLLENRNGYGLAARNEGNAGS